MLTNKILVPTLISFLLFIQGCSDKKEEQSVIKEITKSTVEINTIQKINYPIWVDFSGKTQAVKNVNITSRITGELEMIHFNDGDQIDKNQLLFSIDKTKYKTILAQKNALLQKDIASLELSTANFNRYKPLVEKGLATQEKLDQLQAEQKQLEATITADKANVKQAKLDVEHCQIQSTITGKIGKALVDVGNIINTGDKLAHIVQTDYLYVNFSPSSSTVSLIKAYKSQENPTVKVLINTQSKQPIELNGEIDFIDNISNQETDTVAIRAKIDNNKQLLFPGTFVELKMFITDKIPLIALNPNFIAQGQLGTYVFVVDKNNKIQKKQIKTSYSNSDLIIVEEGLEVGDKVIVSDTNKLKVDQIVETKEVTNKVTY